jgi:hypothetical protein
MFLLAEPSLSLGNRAEGGGSEWETRLSVEGPMLSTGLHLTSESTAHRERQLYVDIVEKLKFQP